ncbi:MAG: N-acetylneuraminate synthase family protein, partial [bacterium]
MNILEVFKNYDLDIINRPYVIAEAGVNHEGDMDLAKRLIDEAADGGAHAIKFQTYKAESLASKDSPSYWDLNKEPTQNQVELFKKYDKFWKKEYEELKKVCDNRGIEFLSTPFDTDAADFLNDMMPAFKISSSDITNLPFIEYMCKFGKPIILSTGASNVWEIQQAVELIEKFGNPLSLLHCV